VSVKIRLLRAGAKHRPFYRVVVTDSRSPRDGRFIETLGYYDPLPDKQLVKIDQEKAKMWLDRGATPTDTVKSLLKRAAEFGNAEAVAEEAKAKRAAAVEEANRLSPKPKPKADEKPRPKADDKPRPKADDKPRADAKPKLDVKPKADEPPKAEAKPAEAKADAPKADAPKADGDEKK